MISQYKILLDGIPLIYVLRRDRRARHFRIILHDDGHCVVTVPYPFGRPAAEKFLHKQASWIAIQRKKTIQRKLLSGYNSKEEYQNLKEKSREFVLKELEYCNAFYAFSFTGVSIRNQRSRWGSCSSAGRLNFHYKIILLPRKLARYIIVHELCHLKEMNHSARFWSLVAKTIPEYKTLREELRNW